MKKIIIGLLLPSSTILPMGKDFETGLKAVLKEHLPEDAFEIELVSEFIGQGNKNLVEDAINKLLNYHQVEIVTGIVSNRIAMDVAEKFEKHKKPFLVNNIGEHIPDPKYFNPYIFINSNHTWQQIWSLGNWAVKKFGSRGMFVGSIYDAGYCFTSMFRLGMNAADPESVMPFSIAQIPNGGKTADPKSVFEHIKELNPDFILSVFCGDEAKIFQEEYIKSGYSKLKPLIALPYLLQSFESEMGDSLEVYTTMVAANGKIDSVNFNDLNSDNPFKALGAETGLILTESIKISDGNNLAEALKNIKVKSKRGLLQIDSSNPGANNEVYLIKNIHNGDKIKIEREILEKLETVNIEDQTMVELLNEPSSGWFNPYLGV